ncbi:MAG: N-acetylneuraminate synthase family protein [Candidatus Glassbacteria bacterium]|nr:N-acetylneuraminate synthase family protein [Candidatus Glassbacteria bacterium]
MKTVRIGSERTGFIRLGPGLPCAVMAEVGINHDGSLDRALELVGLAAGSGADLVKFQYLDPDAMVHAESLPGVYETYRKYALTPSEMKQVALACEARKIPFVCTVFDLEGAARMVEAGVSAFKVASCDMTHLPLVRGLGEFGLPLILSTGLADTAEVAAAVRAAKRGGCRTPVLLHCVSAYPAPDDQLNLRAIETMQRRFRLPVGLSDHTCGILATALAAVLGAVLVEKHFTYDPQADGPDHSISLGPEEFRAMAADVRRAGAMRGHGRKVPAKVEHAERRVGRRGYYLRHGVRQGEKVRLDDLAALKPWTEIGPFQARTLRGAVYARDLEPGSQLNAGDLVFPEKTKQ